MHPSHRTRIVSWLVILPVVFSLSLRRSAKSSSANEWRFYGGDAGGTRYSSLKQINRSNVVKLKRAWTYHTGELNLGTAHFEGGRIPAFECTPLVIDGVLYLSTPSSRVIALDAENGSEIWKFDPHDGKSGKRPFWAHRGVAYWEGPSNGAQKLDKRILLGTSDGKLMALDAGSGQPMKGFGHDGAIDLREGVADKWPSMIYTMTSPASVYKDLVITGAQVPEFPARGPSGDVRAFDVRTGKLVWQFHTVPHPGEQGHETWEGDSWKERTGVNVWSIMSVDVEHGIVFLPTGSPAHDFYGGDRKGQNLFGNSLVALEASTGKLLWFYQMVHHDIWDYDLPAQPTLITLRREGREVPAVAQVGKMGFIFVLNRLTGQPLFPVEERAVPQSKVPGEATWPTQPFPLKPPPLSRQNPVPKDDITKVTPESSKYCTELLEQSLSGGVFTPLGLEQTTFFPGTLGGATWSGGSFDPATETLYVNANEAGALGWMKAQAPDAAVPYRRTSKSGEYARFWDENHWPCQQPPWGTLNAVDLNRGEMVWKVPLGVIDELETKGVPKTGTPNLGGSIVTAGGLVFIASSNDARFRAFDAKTGAELWVTQMEASGHATPMTFQGKKSRKQFVVIAAGGGGSFSKTGSDVLAAYSLGE